MAHEVGMHMSRFEACRKFAGPERGVRVAKVQSRHLSCAAHVWCCLSFPPTPHPPPSPLFPVTLFAGCLAALQGTHGLVVIVHVGVSGTQSGLLASIGNSWTSQAPNLQLLWLNLSKWIWNTIEDTDRQSCGSFFPPVYFLFLWCLFFFISGYLIYVSLIDP